MTTERRTRNVPRYPDRRAHDFWSPWPTALRTKCERCGRYFEDHETRPVLPTRDEMHARQAAAREAWRASLTLATMNEY